MKGREAAGKGPPSADLLVCFPTRAHLRLMPKPICSPSRPSDTSTRRHQHHPRQHHPQPFPHHHRRNKSSGGGGGHASPVLWAKTKAASNHHQNSDMSEPTSPKVTCAGQIKVRPSKPSSCKNWQSVMEEIERLHNHRKQKKRSAWTDALGFKKDVMQFLTCLRNVRFDFRCFGSYPTAVISSDDEDEDDDEDDDDEIYEKKVGPNSKEESDCNNNNNNNSGDVFSKWFMILQEDRGKEFVSREEAGKGKMIGSCLVDEDEDDDGGAAAAPPPANALLLMRCRSAPAKSWLEEREEEEEREREEQAGVVVMRCGTEFSKLSDDIAKETWIVGAGGIKDMLSRSTSSRR